MEKNEEIKRVPYTYYFACNKYRKKIGAQIPNKVTIEVSEFWYKALRILDKLEYNNNHTETRRHVSYEALELLDDFMIPRQFYSEELDPLYLMISEERETAHYALYDKIMHGMGILTHKQLEIFCEHLFCEKPFRQIAHAMCSKLFGIPEPSQTSIKKHYYRAVEKLRNAFSKEYQNFTNFFE